MGKTPEIHEKKLKNLKKVRKKIRKKSDFLFVSNPVSPPESTSTQIPLSPKRAATDELEPKNALEIFQNNPNKTEQNVRDNPPPPCDQVMDQTTTKPEKTSVPPSDGSHAFFPAPLEVHTVVNASLDK